MNKLSLKPDDDMKWIYDCYHPAYNSAEAEHLRGARARALLSCPRWMKETARMNDLLGTDPEGIIIWRLN